MTTMTIGRTGELTLPPKLQEKCSLIPETDIKIIETRSGIFLVSLTDTLMSANRVLELQEWQELGQEAWEQFSYEEDEA